MKKTGIAIILMLGASICTSTAQESNVYIAVNKVLASAPKYTKNVQKVDSIAKGYEAEITLLQKTVDIAYSAFLKENKVVKEETLAALKKRIPAMSLKKLELLQEDFAQINKRIKSYQELVALVYKTEVKSIEIIVTEIINTYAEKNNIQAIHNLDALGNALVYVDEKLMMTDTMIELVQKSSKFKKK